MIQLGSKVKHLVNGFEGIATGRAEYLTGCTQYLVAPSDLDKDGKLRDSSWFDEGMLLVTGEPAEDIKGIGKQADIPNGGPQSDAPAVR